MFSYFDVLSVQILFSSFILMANKRIKSYIKTFRIQSLLIALTAGAMGFSLEKGRIDLLVVCLLIIVLKVILIPNMLEKTYASVEYIVEKDFILNIPILVILSCALVVFSYFSVSTIEGINSGIINAQIVNSMSVILIGLFFMISRKKAIGQIVGFLVVENGLYVTALFSTHGLPFIVDLGVFIDVLTAVVIMGFMVFNISEKFDSIDIEKLNKLRG
ncbi:MAG: hydrogenase [Clostridia bacterium]|nr:hydrogenase [Clostridia bacterium]